MNIAFPITVQMKSGDRTETFSFDNLEDAGLYIEFMNHTVPFIDGGWSGAEVFDATNRALWLRIEYGEVREALWLDAGTDE